MFQVKICGVTSLDDARAVADSAADAIGLNFFAGSPRCVSVQVAEQICRFAEGRLLRVGVFVNAQVEQIERLRTQLPLDLVQLHGDEPPETTCMFPDSTVVRAIRFRQQPAESQLLEPYLRLQATRQLNLAAVLVDAYQPGQYGGTGHVVDWDAVRRREGLGPWPIVLAGGLNPDNISRAVEQARPDAVDTASGVESQVGRKDPQKIRLFAERAKEALARPAPDDSAREE